ncbi:2Fe-2S iron-sulfur cluster binding domain-containing protein [Oxalobacteraceae bacterium]|nr:2Fe-2S iron-sulfur cluster binding domain-containing protein [Oxalobacteraceae bacterium]
MQANFPAADDAPVWRVAVEPKGLAFDAGAATSVLLAAEQGGVRLPSSCRNGTCRTCICRLRSGSVRYLIEWPGLSPDEKIDGYILPCVAVAQSDLVIEAPAAKALP